ncbi:carbohydrate sulfotransferase 15-like isoform X2 [Strongylocentrotus purpuratus]|uniref:Sulfotransferase domain-containing protein n=1 Tax=Strongylocentrotus purpuratus TaxID=7668 RepID=A0A7M7LW65_STRPU|nr:carbohydrate sulfotransferase 15-like isoform X2 [Strongylocentrotus purpuratus]
MCSGKTSQTYNFCFIDACTAAPTSMLANLFGFFHQSFIMRTRMRKHKVTFVVILVIIFCVVFVRVYTESRDESPKAIGQSIQKEYTKGRGEPHDQGRDTRVRISPIADPDLSEDLSKVEHGGIGMDAHTSPKIQTPLLRHIASDIISMKPDIFETVPRQFLPDYKSPCWFNKQNELYCLPYFYIIGVDKCGTTDLWDKITQHPDVLASVPKEPHWWGKRRHGCEQPPIHQKEARQISKMIGEKNDSSIEWYLNWFKTFGVKSIESSPSQNADGDVTFPKVFCDASISTCFNIGKPWEEGNYTNADLIHAVQPQAKIVMIIRNPTQRFFSGFMYNSMYRDKSSAALDLEVKEKIHCLTSCLQKHSERYCVFTKTCEPLNTIYLTLVKDWMRVYGRDGVYVLRLEDWRKNCAEELKKLIIFLELPALPKDEILRITRRKTLNVNARKAQGPALWNTTRDLLQDFFRPLNKRFASFMNDTRFLYNEG